MSGAVTFGPFELDPAAFRLRRAGVPVAVEPKALDVLLLLVARSPRVVDKGEIFSIVWKDVAVTDNALTRVVAQLRKVLEDDPKSPRYIETVATRGYRFIAPLGTHDETARPSEPIRSNPTAAIPESLAVQPRTAVWTRQLPIALLVLSLAVIVAWAGLRGIGSGPARPSWMTAEGTPDVARLATLRAQQLTAGQGYDGFLAFAPDGKSIAFSSDRLGAVEIYVQGLAPASAVTALTANGRQNVQPAWSPDGQYLAYHEMAGDGVWIVPSRGGVARKISDAGSHPAWSPDGQRIAFETIQTNDLVGFGSPGGLGTIGIVDVDGRTPPTFVTRSGEPAGPHLLPSWLDRTRIMFAAGLWTEGTLALWSTDVNGSQPSMVAKHPRLSANHVLTSDRTAVFFISNGAIWRLPLAAAGEDATEPQAMGLQTGGASIGQLTLSLDGTRLAWTVTDTNDHLWVSDPDPAIAVRAKQLTRGLGVRYGLPAPSSDGRLLAVGNRPGSPLTTFLIAPGAEPRQLTTHPEAHGGARWMAGEREVAVLTDHDGGPAFVAIDPATGRERMLFHLADLPTPTGSQRSSAAPATNIAFAPDFTRLAMAIVKDGRQNLWVAGLRHFAPDGTLVQKTFEQEGGSYPVWSPDGRWLAYQCNEGANTHVCSVDMESGERTQLTHEAGQSWVGGWMPDSNEILFAARREAVWNVAAVSRISGDVRMLTHFAGAGGYVRYPRWDSANNRVIFERSEATGRIWSVELPK